MNLIDFMNGQIPVACLVTWNEQPEGTCWSGINANVTYNDVDFTVPSSVRTGNLLAYFFDRAPPLTTTAEWAGMINSAYRWL